MKFIISESQYKRLNKSSQSITNAIVRFMDEYVSEGRRKITKKPQNYGDLREDWCVNGKETITAIYYFEKNNFDKGYLSVSKQIVESLSKMLSIRQSYVLNTIAEWYDEKMVPQFENIVGESGLGIDDIDVAEKDHECIPEPEKPEGISEEDMIVYIINHTLYDREEIIEKIESGEENLEDLFLQIVDIQNRKRITGF